MKILFAVLIVLISGYVNGQSVSPAAVTEIELLLSKSGDTSLLIGDLKISILEGWHLNSNKPLDEFLTPTEVSFKDSSFFDSVKITYPVPELLTLSFSETEVAVYSGDITIKIELYLKKEVPKELLFEGVFTYQACNDATCLIPFEKVFKVEVNHE